MSDPRDILRGEMKHAGDGRNGGGVGGKGPLPVDDEWLAAARALRMSSPRMFAALLALGELLVDEIAMRDASIGETG